MYFHIWFVTKYRKPILKEKIKDKIKEYFEEIIARKKYRVLELETNLDHVHALVEAKDRNELSEILRTLKAVSAKKILDTPHLRVGNNSRRKHNFWARKFGCKQVNPQEIDNVRLYIRKQNILDTTGVSL